MSKHYATKLKEENAQIKRERDILIQALESIVKGSRNPQLIAHLALKNIGLIPFVVDNDLPENSVILVNGLPDEVPKNVAGYY